MIVGCYIELGRGGWYVEWAREMGDGSIRVQRWYGSRLDVEERAKLPPDRGPWHRLAEEGPPHDAATATGMYDA